MLIDKIQKKIVDMYCDYSDNLTIQKVLFKFQ